MIYLFEVANQNSILGFVPESLGVLIFAVGLILSAFALRRLLKRSEKNAELEAQHITQ